MLTGLPLCESVGLFSEEQAQRLWQPLKTYTRPILFVELICCSLVYSDSLRKAKTLWGLASQNEAYYGSQLLPEHRHEVTGTRSQGAGDAQPLDLSNEPPMTAVSFSLFVRVFTQKA